MDRAYLILSGCCWHHTGGGQQPTQIARALAARGASVAFYQDQPAPDDWRPPAGVQLFHVAEHLRSAFWSAEDGDPVYWRWFGSGLSLDRLGAEKWAIVTCPTPWFLAATRALRKWGWNIAYWLLDDWAEFGFPYYRPEVEAALLTEADAVFATALPLAALAARLGREAIVVPNGYDSAIFPTLPPTRALGRNGKRRLVYWGGVAGPIQDGKRVAATWLDLDLVMEIAQRRPDWRIDIIGGVPDQDLGLPNLQWHEVMPVEELPHWGARADIGIIPFREGPLARAVNPIKAYEYLACGLAVLATPMPELDGWPGVTQASGPDAWIEAIDELRYPDAEAVAAFLRGRSWAARAEAFERALPPDPVLARIT